MICTKMRKKPFDCVEETLKYVIAQRFGFSFCKMNRCFYSLEWIKMLCNVGLFHLKPFFFFAGGAVN